MLLAGSGDEVQNVQGVQGLLPAVAGFVVQRMFHVQGIADKQVTDDLLSGRTCAFMVQLVYLYLLLNG